MPSKRKTIKELDVKGKRVLVRCDFNVTPEEDGSISSDLRIRQALPTIKYLIRKKSKVILLSHFGNEKESISPIKKVLEKLLRRKVSFVEDCIGERVEKKISEMNGGDVLLLENVRMYDSEKENSLEFGKRLSLLADVYINDAFSVSHRSHASVTRPPLFLPSATGFLMEKEISVLDKVVKNPKRPVVAIIGGAKVESKIKAVNYFLENADHVLLGGKIANMVLIVREIASNLPWPDEDTVKVVNQIDYTSPKLHIPVDVIASLDNTGEKETRETGPGKVGKEEDIFDIGNETIKLYGDIIKEANTIIWTGPLGFSEREAFENGTKEVGRYMAKNRRALTVIGGGDTNKAFLRFNLFKKVDFVSYGGGAMLTYISKGPMPGIAALEQ
jgi:3-phosphoglycerate kinase